MSRNTVVESVIEGEVITLEEATRLIELELIVETGLTVFVAVGNALLEIRDSRLYRQNYRTFEAYCRDRWGMVRRNADRLIQAAEVAENLGPIGLIPQTESQARPLTRLEPEVQREVWQAVVESTPVEAITAKAVEEKVKAAEPLNDAVKAIKEELEPPAQQSIIPEQTTPKDRIIAEATEKVKTGTLTVLQAAKEIEKPHISKNSGNNEWYTPKEYTEAARAVMEAIDLDPASSEIANRNVMATRYFSISDNGLSKPWHGRVWMNPPYSSDLVGKFCSKLAEDYDSGTVTQACVLLNNATETKWFQALLKKAVAVCFPACRIRYLTEAGEPANSPLQGQAIFYLGRNKKRFADYFSKFGQILYGDL